MITLLHIIANEKSKNWLIEGRCSHCMSLVVKRITFIGTAIPGQIGNTFRITTAHCPILNQFESIYDPFSLHYFVIISLFLEGYFMVIVMAPYK